MLARPGRRRDLSRERLIAAALELVDEGGAAALSVRRLARAVDVTPMAIYNHFRDRRDLLTAVADRILGEVEFDGGRADWRDQIRHCFGVMRALCLRRPVLPFLLQDEGAVPGRAFVPLEVTLRALQSAGVDELDAVRTYFLLVSATLSSAAYEVSGGSPDLDPAQSDSHALARLGLARVAERGLGSAWDSAAAHAFAVDLILAGLQSRVSPDAPVPAPG